MKKSGLLVSGLFMIISLLFYSNPVIAEEKCGVFDLQQVLTRCDAGRENVEILKKMESDRVKPIEEQAVELKKIKEELDQKKTVLTEAAFREREMDVHKKQRDLEIMANDVADEMKAREQVMLNKLLPEIEKVIRTIGEREKYTMIIDVRNEVYFGKDINLTQKVIEELNKTYKP